MSFPLGLLSSKVSICQCKRHRLDPWVRKNPWRRAWQPAPIFLPGESHGQRSLAGYRPWGRKESDTTKQLTLSLSLHVQSWGWDQIPVLGASDTPYLILNKNMNEYIDNEWINEWLGLWSPLSLKKSLSTAESRGRQLWLGWWVVCARLWARLVPAQSSCVSSESSHRPAWPPLGAQLRFLF